MTMERTAAVEHVGGRSRKRRSRWFTGKFLVLSLAGATLLAAAAALVVPQFQDKASAATNGQLIGFCGMPGDIVGVKIVGNNQDNQPTQRYFTFGSANSDGCQHLGGHWWKGDVSIDWRSDFERPGRLTKCFVPEVQGDSDETQCNY